MLLINLFFGMEVGHHNTCVKFEFEGYLVKVKVTDNFSVSELLHGFVLEFDTKQAVSSQLGGISG